MGLRASEIAKLTLADIDWASGTVRLRRTKSRRHDVLPLPAATGQAIAQYLRFHAPECSVSTGSGERRAGGHSAARTAPLVKWLSKKPS
jgi:integrase